MTRIADVFAELNIECIGFEREGQNRFQRNRLFAENHGIVGVANIDSLPATL
jgi:hypothetical protein